MKTIIKLPSIIIVLCLLFASCKKENNSNGPGTASPSCKPLSLVNGGLKKTFTYSGELLSSIQISDSTGYPMGSYSYEYSASRIIKAKKYDNNGSLVSMIAYDYNNIGISAKHIYQMVNSNLQEYRYTKYTYTGNNITADTEYYSFGPYPSKYSYSVFSYSSAGNIIKVQTYAYNQSRDIFEFFSLDEYEYDFKLKPLKGIPYEDFAPLMNNSSNVTKENYADINGEKAENTSTYIYNEKGFPTSITTKYIGSTDISTLDYLCK